MTDSGGSVALAARILLPCLVAAMPALAALALASGTVAAQSTSVAPPSLDAGGATDSRIEAMGRPMRLKGRPRVVKPNAKASTIQGARKSTLRAKRRAVRTRWSRSQIRRAQARCAKVLRGLNLVVVPLAPMRRNSCGTAAPMKLVSIGSKPKILLSPAPTLTCDMAAAMHRWVLRDVQPMARKYLGAPIKRINIMSSYSCRNAYGRRHGKLSQHARASALDIRGFETTRGLKTAVLSHWGPRRRRRPTPALATGARPGKTSKGHAKARYIKKAPSTRRKSTRAIKRQRRREAAIIRAARKAARKFASNKKSANKRQAASTAKVLRPRRNKTTPALRSTITGMRAEGPAAAGKPNDAKALWNAIFADVNYLGASRRTAGRRSAGKAAGGSATGGINRSAFLRAIHKRACKVFGTVLGPNANFAHRHHFHVDTQRRKLGHYCR